MSQCDPDLPLLCYVTIGTPGKLLITTFRGTVTSGSKRRRKLCYRKLLIRKECPAEPRAGKFTSVLPSYYS